MEKGDRGGWPILNAVIVKGCDNMTAHQVEKIFAAYRPYHVEMADESSSVVHFLNKSDAAAMMIHQTKSLRRVRAKREPEEGEVREDEEEEEEGQLMEEQGDDVAVEEEASTRKTKEIRLDFVDINVDEVDLPEGKWRVVTKHVPERRLILVRFATEQEEKNAHEYHATVVEGISAGGRGFPRKRRAYESDDGFTYTWNEERVRPGLNIFKPNGEELEWDYDHDTRFYEDLDNTAEEEVEDKVAQESWPAAKKVRGRGARNARFGNESSLTADKAEKDIPPRRKMASRISGGLFGESDGEGEDVPRESRDIDDPTPQPWDRPVTSKRLRGRITFE